MIDRAHFLCRLTFLVAVVASALGPGCDDEVAVETDANDASVHDATIEPSVVDAPSDEPAANPEELAAEIAAQPPAIPAEPGCTPQGELPPVYRRRVVEDPLIDLRRGWAVEIDVKRGAGKNADGLGQDDPNKKLMAAPGRLPFRAKKKRTYVVISRRFSLSREDVADGSRPLFLDLGQLVGTATVYLDGKRLGPPFPKNSPLLMKLPALTLGEHTVAIELVVGRSAQGVLWSQAPGIGYPISARRGLLERRYKSRVTEKPRRLTLYAPKCADLRIPAPLLVALPGWNGTIWSYAHSHLLDEANERGWIVVTPETGGNTLYTGPAEAAVLEAIEIVRKDIPIDERRIVLLGVSMGGAGALQIGYHYPDKFAALVAFFGDSQYDMRTYVRKILRTKANANRYSVLQFAANARNTPVLLIHARDDEVSPFEQSQWLADEAKRLGLDNVKLIAVPEGGHSVRVVEEHVLDVFDVIEPARRPERPSRVSFRTNSWDYTQAFWLDVIPKAEGVFGSVDVSVVGPSRTLVIHKLDSGLEAARIHMDRIGFTDGKSFSLAVESEPQAAIVLDGFPVGAVATFESPGHAPSERRVTMGGLKLPTLPPKTYKVTVER